jgi:membrane protease YdiL (CAAX protease family)
VITTFALLALAILALWLGGDDRAPVRRRDAWLLFLAGSLVAALTSGVVRPVGLVWVAVVATATHALGRRQVAGWQRHVAQVIFVAVAAGLAFHRLPGFNNPRVIDAVRFSADAIPYTLYLNYDKALAGLFVLGWCHTRIFTGREWRTMLMMAAPWSAGLIGLVMVLSLAAGYVRFDPRFPAETWLWLIVNLGLTCMAEEALFRGFVQAQLQRAWQHFAAGRWLALGVAAVLFGVAHAAGGATYVALATFAGLGYGWVYQRTGRIEASILTHFTLNAAHFFFFTYPALQR